MYKLTKYETVIRLLDGACIPFDPANTDYQNFKRDLQNGAKLADANDKPVDSKTFLAGLK